MSDIKVWKALMKHYMLIFAPLFLEFYTQTTQNYALHGAKMSYWYIVE